MSAMDPGSPSSLNRLSLSISTTCALPVASTSTQAPAPNSMEVGSAGFAACPPAAMRAAFQDTRRSDAWRFPLKLRRGYGNSGPWYGWFASIEAARYNCSATSKRTSMCGRVSGPSDHDSSARCSTSGACPSGPPMRNARSRPARASVPAAATTVPNSTRGRGRRARPPAHSSAARRRHARPPPPWRARHRGPCRAGPVRFRPVRTEASATGAGDSRRKPCATQDGARSPTAMRRAFTEFSS